VDAARAADSRDLLAQLSPEDRASLARLLRALTD
jgi:hypothetical protein